MYIHKSSNISLIDMKTVRIEDDAAIPEKPKFMSELIFILGLMIIISLVISILFLIVYLGIGQPKSYYVETNCTIKLNVWLACRRKVIIIEHSICNNNITTINNTNLNKKICQVYNNTVPVSSLNQDNNNFTRFNSSYPVGSIIVCYYNSRDPFSIILVLNDLIDMLIVSVVFWVVVFVCIIASVIIYVLYFYHWCPYYRYERKIERERKKKNNSDKK